MVVAVLYRKQRLTVAPEPVPLDLLVAFNHDPMTGLHPDWWQRLPHGDLVRRLRDCATARPFLCRYLHRALEVDESPALEFSNPLWRIALLPADALETLCLRVGCLRHAEPLSRVVTRRERWRVEEMLGHGIIEEALQGRLRRPVPSVWRIDALPADRESVARAGMVLLLAPLHPLPEAVWTRLRLKLPPAWSYLGEAGESKGLGEDWLLRQIQEALPSWRDLFA